MSSKQRLPLQSLALLLAVLLGGCSTLPDLTHQDNADGTPKTWQETVSEGDGALLEGNRDQALAAYVNALNLNPKSHETLHKIALIHTDKGNPDLAYDAFRMALKLSPNYAPSLEGLGLLLLQQRQFDKARQQFLAATQTDPKRWRSYNGLGLIADQQKQFQAALAYYNQALSLNPTAMLFNNRGYSNYLAGHWDVAEQDYLRALRIDEKYDRALYNLGLLQTRQGKELEALGTFKKTLDEAAAYNNMGYIYMLDGQYAEADAYLQRAISSSPTYHVQANLNMQRLHELWKK